MADGLLNKASIILTPTGYKAGTLYNVAPVVEPYEDFDFARASVASRVNSSGLVEMVGRTLGSELVQNGDFSELGSELVTNGSFDTDSDWIKGTGYTISDGNLKATNTLNNALTFQNKTYSFGTYKVTANIDISNGSLRFQIGGSIISQTFTTSGLKVFYLNVTSQQAYFGIATKSDNSNFSIDNVSVKQVDPNDYWTLGTGWSIGDGIAEANNTSTFIEQSGLIEASKLYRLTFQARLKSGTNGTINAYIGGSNNKQFTISDTNWQSFTYINTRGSSIATSIYFNNNGTELELDNISVKEVIDTNNIPRISYDSNGDNGHILLEPTSTNLVPYSEDFSQWALVNGTILSNTTTSPTGEINADKFTFISGYAQLRYTLTVASSTQYSASFYVKNLDATNVEYRVYDVTNGTDILSSSYYSEISNTEWTRVSFQFNTSATTSSIYFYPIAGSYSGSLYIWGAQLEALSHPTSYIPTLTGSTVTRATETATGAGSATLINSTEGVLYAEIAFSTNGRIAIKNSDSSDDQVVIGFSGSIFCRIREDGANVVTKFDGSANQLNTYYKIAIKYKSGNSAMWVNGSETDFTDTFTLNNLNEVLFISEGSRAYGKCKALAVFNEALSDSELTQLTT